MLRELSNAAGVSGGPFGILEKASGNNCGGYSCDIICSGQGNAQKQWDVLIDGGCDPLLLLQQGMVTPACGLAGLDPPQADRVLELAGHLAHRIEAEALDAGLNVGA